jgi:hypothetical protein
MWGTDSWHGSEWFPAIINDLVGRDDVVFRPNTREEQENLYMRKIKNFIPRASESPQGEFWRNVKEGQAARKNETCMERETKLPYHESYVYSPAFLASVMLLVYEVL